jgi:hypothetical protein
MELMLKLAGVGGGSNTAALIFFFLLIIILALFLNFKICFFSLSIIKLLNRH